MSKQGYGRIYWPILALALSLVIGYICCNSLKTRRGHPIFIRVASMRAFLLNRSMCTHVVETHSQAARQLSAGRASVLLFGVTMERTEASSLRTSRSPSWPRWRESTSLTSPVRPSSSTELPIFLSRGGRESNHRPSLHFKRQCLILCAGIPTSKET